MTAPQWITPAGFLGTATEAVNNIIRLSASGSDIAYSVISGTLPKGLLLSRLGYILGTPENVIDKRSSKFVVRAQSGSKVSDRTFMLDVRGPNPPIWTTAGGYLNLGYNGAIYAMNHEYISAQLAAAPVLDPVGTTLKYHVSLGQLPPGVSLSETGLISGVIRDHFYNTTSTVVGEPKIYQFRVTASDGVSSAESGIFKILVISSDMLRADSTVFGFSSTASIYLGTATHTATSYISTASSIGHLQQPQFLNGNNLGTVRANNNQFIPVTAYDADPTIGPVSYSIVNGPIVETQLPQGLNLDPATGYIYGYLTYQPAYVRDYTLTIQATKTDLSTGARSTATNVFSLSVKGEVESSIEWVRGSNLGSISTGVISDLYVLAREIKSDYTIKYQLISGALPNGLTLTRDGTIVGSAEYGTAGDYSFTVLASDIYEFGSISRTFSLTVTEVDHTRYTSIYVRPFLPQEKRKEYRDFIGNSFTFDPSLIYRYFDTNFGVQHDIKVVIDFGIEQLNLDQYAVALRQNFYRRTFYFGNVKTAIASDSTGNIIYEVVYVDIVDNIQGSSMMVNNNGKDYYPASIDNMRQQLSSIKLPDYSNIKVNRDLQPKFMNTQQPGDFQVPNYMHVVPLCYALPGQGSKIVSRIKLSGFDFKQLSFEVDRLVVQNSLDNSSAKYLLLERQSLSDTVKSDNILYDGTVDWQFDDNVILTRK